MIKGRWWTVCLTLFVLVNGLGVGGQSESHSVSLDARQRRIALRMSPLPPAPPSPTNAVADDPRAQQLGRELFFDRGLSANGTVACSTCHDPSKAFGDGRPVAEGLGLMDRHTPSLLNVAHHRWFFWDGRADSLWAQALEPLEEPKEMGSNRVAVARHVYTRPRLRAQYEALFGPLPNLDDPKRFPTAARPWPESPQHEQHRAWLQLSEADRAASNRVFVNIGKSLEAYQRQLVSADAPFDRFVAGLRDHDLTKLAAMSPAAVRGYQLFVGKAQCRTCHFGPNFTDREFHNTRVPPRKTDVAGGEGAGSRPDPGRHRGIRRLKRSPFTATSEYSDERDGAGRQKLATLVNAARLWGSFKTPSLRNVSRTAPYMHQGQFRTLRDVVEFYNTLEGATAVDHHAETVLVPLRMSDAEVDDLVEFLQALDGAPVSDLLGDPNSAK